MALQNNTILITGGSSGLGFEMAKRLSEKNKIIICGRSREKLSKARRLLPGIEIIQCDVSQKKDCKQLASAIIEKHPDCNILINNAAIVHRASFYEDEDMIEKSDLEIRTNLAAPITLSKLFIPIVEKNLKPKIINITTGLVYIPRSAYPIYNATKAALHSFTQVLRMQLEKTPISVFEVLFPVVDTPWHNGNAPSIAITPEKAVKEMLAGLDKGQLEIKVGKVKLLYRLSRVAPAFALKKINSL